MMHSPNNKNITRIGNNIRNLALPTELKEELLKHGIETIEGLRNKSPEELIKLPNVELQSLKIIVKVVKQYFIKQREVCGLKNTVENEIINFSLPPHIEQTLLQKNITTFTKLSGKKSRDQIELVGSAKNLKVLLWAVKLYLGKNKARRTRPELLKVAYEPSLIGLTKAGQLKCGWLARASFRDTAASLADAAVCGRRDYLMRTKSQVILSRRLRQKKSVP
jgi:hypothetical protein